MVREGLVVERPFILFEGLSIQVITFLIIDSEPLENSHNLSYLVLVHDNSSFYK